MAARVPDAGQARLRRELPDRVLTRLVDQARLFESVAGVVTLMMGRL